MEDSRYNALLAQLSEAFLGLCDEAEMLRYQAEQLRLLAADAAGTYERIAHQKVAEVSALERYIEARHAILSHIEKAAKQASAAKTAGQVSNKRAPLSLGIS